MEKASALAQEMLSGRLTAGEMRIVLELINIARSEGVIAGTKQALDELRNMAHGATT